MWKENSGSIQVLIWITSSLDHDKSHGFISGRSRSRHSGKAPFSSTLSSKGKVITHAPITFICSPGTLRNINDVLCDGFITQDPRFILTGNFTNTAMRKLKSARFLGISFSLRGLFVIPITTVEGGGGAPDPSNIKTVLK